MTLYQAFFFALSASLEPLDDDDDDFFESFKSSCDLLVISGDGLVPSVEVRDSCKLKRKHGNPIRLVNRAAWVKA